MLLSKLKEIRNGRMIKKTKDGDNDAKIKELEQKIKDYREGLTKLDNLSSFEKTMKAESILSSQIRFKHEIDRLNNEIAKLKSTNDSKTKDEEKVESYKGFDIYKTSIALVARNNQGIVIKDIRYGGGDVVELKKKIDRFIKTGVSDKTKDRNIVNINKERRNLEDAYEQALRDGDKGLAKQYSIRLEELRKEAIEAENKDSYDPTKPKNIAAAKKLSVAQGKAAVGDKKVKDGVAPELVDKLMDSHIGTAKVWNRKQVEKVLQILTAQGSIGTNTPFTVIIGKVDREIGGDKKTKDGETVAQFKGFNIEKLNNGQFQAVDYGYISSPLRLKPPQSSIEEVKKQINDYLK